MGNRQTIHHVLTLLGSVAVVLTLSAGTALPAQPPVELRPIVTAARTNSELTVTWVFRGEDLFACETVAYDLRRVLGEYGERVEVRAIGINADEELVASFLRKERLPIQVAPYTEVQYRQAFGTTNSPAVFIARPGQPVRTVFASNAPQVGRQSSLGLYEVVTQMLARPARTIARAQ
jgi:hypothetical protein